MLKRYYGIFRCERTKGQKKICYNKEEKNASIVVSQNARFFERLREAVQRQLQWNLDS